MANFLKGILGTSIASILTELFTSIKPLTYIKELLISLYTFIVQPITLQLWLLVIIMIAPVGLIILIKSITRNPHFYNYITDTILGVTWQWT